MHTYKEAQQILAGQAGSFGKEKIPLGDALGRVLADTIHADRDYPPFNRAAMDGFAFRLNDFKTGAREFTIADRIYAGHTPSASLIKNACYKIMTGSSVPADADVLVRREDTEENGGQVKILVNELTSFQNIARKGEDLQKGTAIITEPVICTPSVISLLAVIGRSTITVEKLPTVAIITTGNEVIPLEKEASDVQIRNSNLWLLKALLAKHHITPVSTAHVLDDQQQVKQAFSAVMDADIIISCGGVSAGDTDFIPVVLPELGVEKLFHKLSIRPGKPIWCGRRKDGRLVFALPGNPLSCLVTFTVFIQHYLLACYGLKPVQPWQLPLQGKRIKKTSLDEFFPVELVKETAMIRPVSFNGSGDIQAALYADGIAIHPYDKMEIETGTRLEYIEL